MDFFCVPASGSPQRPSTVSVISRPTKCALPNTPGSVASIWSSALSITAHSASTVSPSAFLADATTLSPSSGFCGDSNCLLKTRIRTLTKRNRGRKLEEVIKELNQTLRGWLMYFRLAEAKNWCKETEGWLRWKLRCYRLKQSKRRIGIARFLMQNGCTEHQAWETVMCCNGWW